MTKEQIEAMCVAHHAIRTAQGFTTAPWENLRERNREQYREAMRAAVARVLVDPDVPTVTTHEGTAEVVVDWSIPDPERWSYTQVVPRPYDPTPSAGEVERTCTCHPDDNPPKPCPKRYALQDCRAAALAQQPAQGGDEHWRERYQQEFETVDRCWKALGISRYDQAGGKAIWEIIAERCKPTPTPGDVELASPTPSGWLESLRTWK